MNTMRIRVRMFAILRQSAGTDALDLDLPDGATAQEASQAVAQRFPQIKNFLGKIALAVNHEYADANRPLADGDELALLPAVSGGV